MKVGDIKKLSEDQKEMSEWFLTWMIQEQRNSKRECIYIKFNDESDVPDSFVRRPDTIDRSTGIELNIDMLRSKLERIIDIGVYEYDTRDLLNMLRGYYMNQLKGLFESKRLINNDE